MAHSGSRQAYGGLAPYFRLDIKSGAWRSYPVQRPADVDPIPDAALAQPTLPRSTFQSAFYPWRLTEWVCRDAADSPAVVAAKSTQANGEKDGSIWVTDGRALVHADVRGAPLARFGLNQIGISTTPQISAVTVLNDHLYASTNGDLQSFDLAARTWTRVRIPSKQLVESQRRSADP